MAPAVPIRVGTAGWAYEDWDSIVYPARPGRGFDRLGLMASLFDTNEINSTFYRIPTPRQTADWARRVEHNPRFAFTAKLYRGFTHEWKAGAAEEKAFGDAIAPLARAGRLGCVLAQFPFSFHNIAENRRKLEGLLSSLPRFPTAVEFRHASWNAAETRELLAPRGAAFVNIDQPDLDGNLPPTDLVTAPLAYFRFHGRNAPKWFGPDTSNAALQLPLFRGGARAVGRADQRGRPPRRGSGRLRRDEREHLRDPEQSFPRPGRRQRDRAELRPDGRETRDPLDARGRLPAARARGPDEGPFRATAPFRLGIRRRPVRGPERRADAYARLTEVASGKSRMSRKGVSGSPKSGR